MTKTKNNSTIATVGIPFSILGLSTLKGICNTVYGRIATAEGKKLPDLRASMQTEASDLGNGEDSPYYKKMEEIYNEIEADIATLRSYVAPFEAKYNEMNSMIGDGRPFKYQPFVPMAKAS